MENTENIYDDNQLTKDEFWDFLKATFNEWKEEDRFDKRIDIDGNNYKISFIPDQNKEIVLHIKILRRNGNT